MRRLGPDGPRTLCNACGLRRSKKKRIEAAAASQKAADADADADADAAAAQSMHVEHSFIPESAIMSPSDKHVAQSFPQTQDTTNSFSVSYRPSPGRTTPPASSSHNVKEEFSAVELDPVTFHSHQRCGACSDLTCDQNVASSDAIPFQWSQNGCSLNPSAATSQRGLHSCKASSYMQQEAVETPLGENLLFHGLDTALSDIRSTGSAQANFDCSQTKDGLHCEASVASSQHNNVTDMYADVPGLSEKTLEESFNVVRVAADAGVSRVVGGVPATPSNFLNPSVHSLVQDLNRSLTNVSDESYQCPGQQPLASSDTSFPLPLGDSQESMLHDKEVSYVSGLEIPVISQPLSNYQNVLQDPVMSMKSSVVGDGVFVLSADGMSSSVSPNVSQDACSAVPECMRSKGLGHSRGRSAHAISIQPSQVAGTDHNAIMFESADGVVITGNIGASVSPDGSPASSIYSFDPTLGNCDFFDVTGPHASGPLEDIDVSGMSGLGVSQGNTVGRLYADGSIYDDVTGLSTMKASLVNSVAPGNVDMELTVSLPDVGVSRDVTHDSKPKVLNSSVANLDTHAGGEGAFVSCVLADDHLQSSCIF